MSAQRPDLALFLPSLRGGGAERVMMDLARAAADTGRAVDVVVVNRHGAVTDDLGPGVRIVDLDRGRAATALPAFLRYLWRARPPALLSTLEHTNVLAVVATRLIRGTRVVLREANTPAQDLEYEGRKGRWLLRAMRWAYPLADAVVAVSQGVAGGLTDDLGLAPERTHVVFNPVITPRVLEGGRVRPDHPWFAAGEPPVVLAVGRLVEQKGFDVLLRAFASATARAACRLVILGEGPERDALRSSAERLGVADSVDLPGFVTNPFGYMAHSGVFVLSSRWEGLPNVLIQALAVGAPAVATDCPSGPREVLDGGRWGALVPVDDVEAMADAIVAALDGDAPRLPESWYGRYRLEDVTDAYLAILEPDGDVSRRGKER